MQWTGDPPGDRDAFWGQGEDFSVRPWRRVDPYHGAGGDLDVGRDDVGRIGICFCTNGFGIDNARDGGNRGW